MRDSDLEFHLELFASYKLVLSVGRDEYWLAKVFTSGSTDWAHGLRGKDPMVERITRNVLDKLSGK